MTRMRVGLDIDGVMYQWDKTARYMLRTERGYSKDGPLGRESASWGYIEENVEKHDWQWLWTTGVKMGLFRYGHLYKGTIEAVRTLNTFADVAVITHRPRSAVKDTVDWLSFLNLPFSDIHTVMSGELKSSVQPHCNVYVDDKPENIDDYHEHTMGRALLWRRPWNHGYNPMTEDGKCGEVQSWNDVIVAARKVLP